MVKKRPSIEPSPSYQAAREDARARMRHQALLQDYQDLIKETEAKKKQILKAKQKKPKLFAEVKFLRRKLKSFSGGLSLEIPLKLKKESYKVAPPSPGYEQMHNSGLPSKAHMDDRSHEITEAATRWSSTLSDLNQVSNRTAFPSMRYAQMLNSGLPSSCFSADRNQKATKAAARGTTALLDLNQASNRPAAPSLSYAQTVYRNRNVPDTATPGTTPLSDLNHVSYRPAPLSFRRSHMLNLGLPPKAPRTGRNHKITEPATRGTPALLDLNQISYKPAPPSARYGHVNNSNLPSKAHPIVGNHKPMEVAIQGTATLLDLNQDAEEFEEQETPRIDKLKRFSVGRSASVNDHKLLLSRVGCNKRNQLPLRV